MTPIQPPNYVRWKWLTGKAFSNGFLATVLFVLGFAIIAAGVYQLATPIDSARLRDSLAMQSLDASARSLLSDIARVVRPAMMRTQKLAADPQIADAIRNGNRSAQTEICNKAIIHATEIDCVALFDRKGKILALNSVYASGRPVDANRLQRILDTNFEHRDIIQKCARNICDDQTLEFQTRCDITPALFDSSGLSIAYSVPVRDPATGDKIGVVSSRLRFERLTDLINSRPIGGNNNAIEFVTDQGGYFSEEFNSGQAQPPVPQTVLATAVAPLVSGQSDHCFAPYEGNFLLLYRLEDFVTIENGGIQVMVIADGKWLAKEARQLRTLNSLWHIAGGLMCGIFGGCMLGAASMRRNARLQATLAAVVRFSDDAIFSETLEGRITSWNHAAERIWGLPAEEALGKSVSSILPHEIVEEFLQIGISVRQGLPSRHFDAYFARQNGEEVHVSLSISPLKNRAGEVVGISNIARDISVRKKTERDLATREEQLRQAGKLEAIGSLAGGIAHEFNNLLQIVRGYGQFAMEGLLPDEERFQDLEKVVKAADRAAELTQQLLGFSRRQAMERKTFNHQLVVTDLVALLRPLLGENIELDIALDSDPGPIEADRGMLQQMLLHLCTNARDAMPDGGRLTIKSQRVEFGETYCETHPTVKPGAYVQFSVSDNGNGMTAEVKRRLFEPFFTTKGVGKGTGLGMAMVHGCVQQHSGLINVYSEVGLGTTIRIYLPLVLSAISNAPRKNIHASAGRSEVILIAEDDAMVRNLAVRILTKAGYATIEASNGAEAVSQIEAHGDAIALVLLDAIMPELTGPQAYVHIKRIAPDMPVVFCSGYDPEMNNIQSIVRDGYRLVEKPYDPDMLLQAVREAIDRNDTCSDVNVEVSNEHLLVEAGV